MLKIIYYTSGVTGSGRLVRGISIGNALKRKNIKAEYIIFSCSQLAHLADMFDISHVEFVPEDVSRFTRTESKNTDIYKIIQSLNPDILIIDLVWFSVHHFLDEFKCKKILLCRQVDDNFFSLQLPDSGISLNQNSYDAVIAIEPFNSIIPMISINPIIIRNRSEIKSKNEARNILNIPDEKEKCCLLSFNGNPGDFEKVKNAYSYLENEGYRMIYSTNYKNGIFPVVDYFNAFDLLICGAGYNSFWEAVYFNKETIFIPTFARFESGERRIQECQEYYFDENGADQLADIIMNL